MSGLIQLLLAKTVAISCNVIVCEKSLFLLCRKKNNAFYLKKIRKEIILEEKMIISYLVSGDMAAVHVIANALYF